MHHAGTGKKWTYARVHSMRKQHAIPTGCPLVPHPATKRADGFVSSKMAAERLQVSPSLVNLWVQHGVLRHDQRVAASKVWVQLSKEDITRLTGACPEATSLPTLKSVREQNGLSLHELWHQISLGHYLPYRVARGQIADLQSSHRKGPLPLKRPKRTASRSLGRV